MTRGDLLMIGIILWLFLFLAYVYLLPSIEIPARLLPSRVSQYNKLSVGRPTPTSLIATVAISVLDNLFQVFSGDITYLTFDYNFHPIVAVSSDRLLAPDIYNRGRL